MKKVLLIAVVVFSIISFMSGCCFKCTYAPINNYYGEDMQPDEESNK